MPPPPSKDAARQARPQARPGVHGDRAEPQLQPDEETLKRIAGSFHMPPPREKPAPIKPKQSNKLAWLVLVMLFVVGIGGGAYLGSNRSWEGLTERSITASGNVPLPAPSPSPGLRPAESLASAGPDDNAGAVGAEETVAAPAEPKPEVAAQTEPPAQVATAPAAPAEPVAPVAPVAPAVAQTPPSEEVATPTTTTEAPKIAAIAPDKTAASAPPAPTENELWRSARTSNQPDAYAAYLAAYPKGRHAADARLRLERLQMAKAPPRASEPPAPVPSAKAKREAPAAPVKSPQQSAEELAWTRATTIDNEPAYQSYLEQYPRGGYAALARDRLASMKAGAPPPQPQVPLSEPSRTAAPHGPVPNMQASKPVPQAVPRPEPVQADADVPTVSGNKTLRFGDQTMTGDFDVDPGSGLVSGKVRINWTNGNHYEGSLVRGSKEGKGKFTWANGQRYSGDWNDDLPNGRGRFVFADGSRYEGDVRDGMPHGRGSYWFKGGHVYSGDWVRGKSHGQGRYTWANGSYWEGEFRDDKRTDNGKMGFPDSPVRTATGTAASAGAERAAQAAADN